MKPTFAVRSSLSVLALATISGAQSTWYVDDDGLAPGAGTIADPYTSIQYALAQGTTLPGDVILVSPGTYVETIDFLGKNVWLRSTESFAAVIDANLVYTAVSFVSNEGPGAVLEGFTIVRGKGVGSFTEGGGIRCVGSAPTIRRNYIASNQAGTIFGSRGRGGGVYVAGGAAPVLTGNWIHGNSILAGMPGQECLGAGVYVDASSSIHLENNIISGNSGSNTVVRGGGLYCAGSATLVGNTIAFNNAESPGYGGALYVLGDATVRNGILWGNSADFADSIYVASAGSVAVEYCDLQGGVGSTEVGLGGSLALGSGLIDADPLFSSYDVQLRDFHLRQTALHAGPISPCVDAGDPTDTATGSTRCDGAPDTGTIDLGWHDEAVSPVTRLVPAEHPTIQAAIDLSARGDRILVDPGTYMENVDLRRKSVVLESAAGPDATVIQGSLADGAVRMGSVCGTVLDGFTVTNVAGRGIEVLNGSPWIRNVSVIDCSVAASGGGIYVVGGDPRIESCIVRGNFAGHTGNVGRGGGIFLEASEALLFNLFVHQNQAHSNVTGGRGGGIYVVGGSHVTVVNCTVTFNRATFSSSSGSQGGGLYVDNSPSFATVVNSLFWENRRQNTLEQLRGPLSASYCLVQGGWAGGTAILSGDPLLVASNDYHLAGASPCIDAGDASLTLLGSVPHDLDGKPRRLDQPFRPDSGVGQPAIDIGAHEVQVRVLRSGAPGSSASLGL